MLKDTRKNVARRCTYFLSCGGRPAGPVPVLEKAIFSLNAKD